ncbi:MAG: PIN domain-containing protein [Oceanipulchritudo sp.]
MSRSVMVDSSWYIAQARLGRDPLKELTLAAEDRDIAVCGLIVAEVGRGIRERRFLDCYIRAWAQMLYIPSTRQRWRETLELAWHLDRKGVVIPLQDVHIAACTLSIGAAVLTEDDHFRKIPGLTAVRDVFLLATQANPLTNCLELRICA